LLGSADLIAVVPTTDMAAAAAFYSDVLGLDLVAADEFALTYSANGTSLRVTAVPELEPSPYTVLGWAVDDMASTLDALADAGVPARRFEGMGQDGRGVWTAPGGARVAWFADPAGNLLSVTEAAPSTAST